ncbi:MAG: archaeosortase A [Candidatus Thalassarchaeaceae archaeon]|jgi:archaeosortase A (PGF-CTERM-specific)|nr:archaeosortase A [Candidatus Thalassarchaeaceae archaeon]
MDDPIESLVGSLSESIGISVVTFQLLIGALGVVLLGIGFHRHSESFARNAAISGWPLIGLFFYLYSDHYVEIADPVLILMTAGALPAGIGMAFWETRDDGNSSDSRVWLRGFVVWSMIPYYLVFGVPYLNMGFVYFTAQSADLMLEFSGLGGYEIGAMEIHRHNKSPIPVSDWGGNKWVLSEPLGEGGFYVPMFSNEGEIVVSFILACSALQSMAVFIGAIVALSSVHWKRRMRALLIALPTIHVLNVFRNAGIVWLTDTYGNWSMFGMGMFEFTHSYAAKFASLFAMFLMAIALFDLLPELHRHIMKVLRPLMGGAGSQPNQSDHP